MAALTQLTLTGTPGKRYSFSAKASAAGEHTGGPFTQLILTATPGRRYSFTAKGAAAAHTGLFTELSLTATPGQRHSFLAKDPAVAEGHTGLFTELSLIAVPGMRHTFLAKTAAEEEEAEVAARVIRQYDAGPAWTRRTREFATEIIKIRGDAEDDEILEVISAIIHSGLLDGDL